MRIYQSLLHSDVTDFVFYIIWDSNGNASNVKNAFLLFCFMNTY